MALLLSKKVAGDRRQVSRDRRLASWNRRRICWNGRYVPDRLIRADTTMLIMEFQLRVSSI